jgi:hypothetical protein
LFLESYRRTMASRAEDRWVLERSLATRAALLDAAIECLVDRGYAATTPIETVRRAGVSRGGSCNTSPRSPSSWRRLWSGSSTGAAWSFSRAFAAIDPQADRVDAAVDLLWSMFQGPVCVAWTELWVAVTV